MQKEFKLKTRRDYLNFYKRYLMEIGKPFFHWRYRTAKNISDNELKMMCSDIIMNEKNIAVKIIDSPEGLDGRSIGGNSKDKKKKRYISTSNDSNTNVWKEKKYFVEMEEQLESEILNLVGENDI